MTKRPSLPTKLSLLATLAIAASCGGGGGSGGDAAETLEASLASLRAGKLSDYVERSMSKVQLEKLRADWERQRQQAPTPDEAAQFRDTMAMLTAKDAEASLFAMLAPQLMALEEQAVGMAGALPMLAAGLGGQEAAPAMDALNGLAERLPELGLADEGKLKRAIKVVTKAARELGVKELDGLRALEFPALLDKADVLYGGVSDLLEVYGLSLDETLASTKVAVQSASENQATLALTYSVFGGPPQTSTLEMARVDGRWVPTGR